MSNQKNWYDELGELIKTISEKYSEVKNDTDNWYRSDCS